MVSQKQKWRKQLRHYSHKKTKAMKANELRIGNWGSNGEFELQVTSKDIYLRDVRVFGTVCRGIPITPEWLERFKFRNSALKSNGYVLGDFRVIIWPSGIITVEFKGIEICIMEYIHQLQNLYFALKGEELEIKP